MSADNEIVFVPQMACHEVQCRLHLARVFGVFEVGERFIAELALGRARLNFGRKGHSCHSETSLVLRRNLVPNDWSQTRSSKRLFLGRESFTPSFAAHLADNMIVRRK